MRFNRKPILYSISAIAVTGVVWFGFGTTIGTIDNCVATVSTYVTAEYSEIVTTSSTNHDGNLTRSTHTEYETELASDVYTTTTINGILTHRSHNFAIDTLYSAYYPPIPEYDHMLRLDLNFDKFIFHTDASVTVYSTLLDGSSTKFSDSIDKNPQCIDKRGEMASIDTWYGITYNSDF